MNIKNNPQGINLDEMPVLKKAAEVVKKLEKRNNLGASMVSKNILTGAGVLRFCYRHEIMSGSPIDNGWVFYSDIDDEAFVNVPTNWFVLAWDEIAAIEPAVHKIFDLPVGTDLVVLRDGENRYFCEAKTYEPIIRYCPAEEE